MIIRCCTVASSVSSPVSILLFTVQDKWDGLRDLVQNMASSSKVSNQPAIYGQLAAADVLRLKGEAPAGISQGANTCKMHVCSLQRVPLCACLHRILISIVDMYGWQA